MNKLVAAVVGSALLILGASGIASANLITNGDFETGDLTGWTTKGDITIKTYKNGNDVAHFYNSSNSGEPNTVLRQSLYVDPAWSGVAVNFDFRFATKATVDDNFFNSFLRIETTDTTPYFLREKIVTQKNPTSGWTSVSTFISFDSIDIEDIASNASIVFSMRDYKGDWSNASIDNVSVTAPVPEPSTVLLFGAGLAGLIGYRARRKK